MKRLTTLLMLLALFHVSACHSSEKDVEQTGTASVTADDSTSAALLEEDDKGTPIVLDAPLPLAYHFKRGDRFGYIISSLQQVNLVRDTVEENNRQILKHWYRFEVLEASPNGGGLLLVTCDHVLFSGTYRSPQGNQAISYDSDAENSYDVEKRFAEHNAPVNAPFEITVEPDGRISAVDKLDAVLKNYLRDDYKTTRAQDLAGVKKDLADMKLKPVLQLAFQKLSDAPVAKDSSWSLSKLEHLGYLSYRSTGAYTVKDFVTSPKGRLVHIDYDMTSQYVGKKKLDTGQGMATMDLFDVTGGGLSVFNMQDGRIQRRNLRTDVHVRMYIEPPEEMKKLTQIQNFWMVQKAFIEDKIEPYSASIPQE